MKNSDEQGSGRERVLKYPPGVGAKQVREQRHGRRAGAPEDVLDERHEGPVLRGVQFDGHRGHCAHHALQASLASASVGKGEAGTVVCFAKHTPSTPFLRYLFYCHRALPKFEKFLVMKRFEDS